MSEYPASASTDQDRDQSHKRDQDKSHKQDQDQVSGEYDLVVVGAGIVGLGHAAEAARRGLRVHVLDRDHRAVGASVRNFGHACVTAQHGELLELADSARERWLEYSAAAGFFAVQSGAVAVARTAAELAVLDELSASREAGQVQVLTAEQTRDALGGTADAAIVGGARLRDDLRVDPREAVRSLAAWLEAERGVSFGWATSYLGHDGEAVRTSRGRIRASHTIVCVGHDLDYLYPQIAEAAGIRRCMLNMSLVEPPSGLRLNPAVLTGTSMLRYPAFTATDAAAELQREMDERRPDLGAIGANVMFTQRPDGSIIAGDSHAYDVTTEPFLLESDADTLRAEIARVLGVDALTVRQRWMGVYASAPEPFLVESPQPGVTAVSVTSGVGMTIGLGLARRVIDSLL